MNTADSKVYVEIDAEGTLRDLTMDQLTAINNHMNVDELTQVARDYIGDALISTVFLQANHGTGEPPLIYETAVFMGDVLVYEQKYRTRGAAELGHKMIHGDLKLFAEGYYAMEDLLYRYPDMDIEE